MSSPREFSVMLRLTEEEHAELLRQAAEIQVAEARHVTKSEVLRRRAWGTLPIPERSAA